METNKEQSALPTVAQVQGDGFSVAVRVEDDDDREIVRLALAMGERRATRATEHDESDAPAHLEAALKDTP